VRGVTLKGGTQAQDDWAIRPAQREERTYENRARQTAVLSQSVAAWARSDPESRSLELKPIFHSWPGLCR